MQLAIRDLIQSALKRQTYPISLAFTLQVRFTKAVLDNVDNAKHKEIFKQIDETKTNREVLHLFQQWYLKWLAAHKSSLVELKLSENSKVNLFFNDRIGREARYVLSSREQTQEERQLFAKQMIVATERLPEIIRNGVTTKKLDSYHPNESGIKFVYKIHEICGSELGNFKAMLTFRFNCPVDATAYMIAPEKSVAYVERMNYIVKHKGFDIEGIGGGEIELS